MNKVFDIKKFATAILATLSLVIAIACAGAERVSAYEVGDVIGKAVYADIAAYINGYPIPSYNVDGRRGSEKLRLRRYMERRRENAERDHGGRRRDYRDERGL